MNFPALAKFATNFEDIKAEFEEIPQVTARTSELPEGCDVKNRYANVIPLPETRVFLTPIDGVPNSDYINANYVTVRFVAIFKSEFLIVAFSGPKRHKRILHSVPSSVAKHDRRLLEDGVGTTVEIDSHDNPPFRKRNGKFLVFRQNFLPKISRFAGKMRRLHAPLRNHRLPPPFRRLPSHPEEARGERQIHHIDSAAEEHGVE